jgi:hypothetical protein
VRRHPLRTGRRAFAGETDADTESAIDSGRLEALEELVPGLPPALAASIRKALAAEPLARFANGADFRRELLRAVAVPPAGHAAPAGGRPGADAPARGPEPGVRAEPERAKPRVARPADGSVLSPDGTVLPAGVGPRPHSLSGSLTEYNVWKDRIPVCRRCVWFEDGGFRPDRCSNHDCQVEFFFVCSSFETPWAPGPDLSRWEGDSGGGPWFP